jgi:hypothetical protein
VDILVHLPDLPLAGQDSPKLGLGLWNYPTATILAELFVFIAGLVIYVAFGSHRHPVRTPRLTLVALLLVGTYFASLYGPLPPNMTTVAVSDILFVLAIAALAAWADRRPTPEERETRRISPR